MGRQILHHYAYLHHNFESIDRQEKDNSIFRRTSNPKKQKNIYNQQYIGNLDYIRRLHFISWNFSEISSKNQEQKTFLRRKLMFDQRSLDFQKNVFEHEELEKVRPLKIEKGKERFYRSYFFPILNDQTLPKGVSSPIFNEPRWFQIFSTRELPSIKYSQNVLLQPLYVGWDSERHAFTLSTRFFPLENTICAKIRKSFQFSFYNTFLKHSEQMHYTKIGFVSWPYNRTRRRTKIQRNFIVQPISTRRF